MKSIDELVPLSTLGSGKSRPKPQPPKTSLAQCVLQVGKDLFISGQHGEKARIRSAYQLRKQLGMHQALEAQAQPQDCASRSLRAARAANQMAGQVLHNAQDYWRDEAAGATGLYRGLVGLGQGVSTVGLVGLHGTRAVAKLGVGLTELSYHALRGEVNFRELARQGGQASLTLAEKGARYAVSGQLVSDAKKFSKDLGDYGLRVVHDPMLELPKATVVLGAAVVAVGPQRIAAGARGLSGLLGNLVSRGAAEESLTGLAAESCAPCAQAAESGVAASSAAPAAVEQASGTIGGITPKGWTPKTPAPPLTSAPAIPAPAPAAPPVNQELMRNLQQALKLSQQAPPPPPAPVQLPPANLRLPLKTPVCLPSNNYAPVAPKGYLQILDRLEGGLDILG